MKIALEKTSGVVKEDMQVIKADEGEVHCKIKYIKLNGQPASDEENDELNKIFDSILRNQGKL
jgi:hypothetical protein